MVLYLGLERILIFPLFPFVSKRFLKIGCSWIVTCVESIGRACEPCGTTIIPYPLSTGPNCGDPMYYKLKCDKSNGEVNFTMPALGPNRVTKIIPDERKLIIQIQGTVTCDDKENQIAQLDSPFNVTNWCFGQDKIEVSWIPPLEPLCHNYTECNDWPHSTCNKDSRDGKQRCLCNKHYYWNNSTLNCTSGSSLFTYISLHFL